MAPGPLGVSQILELSTSTPAITVQSFPTLTLVLHSFTYKSMSGSCNSLYLPICLLGLEQDLFFVIPCLTDPRRVADFCLLDFLLLVRMKW